MMRKGEPWGRPVAGPPDLEVHGSDADLAAAVAGHRGARIRFEADASSDLARAVGLSGSPGDEAAATTELPVDALLLAGPLGEVTGEGEGGEQLALNAVVAGVAPDRLRWWHRRRPCTVEVDGRAVFDGPATTVVVANGQFLRGFDVVPRGHPGDGRVEVQVYAMSPAARRPMRRRLPAGDHVPHPDIRQLVGRNVSVRFPAPRRLEVDGRPAPPRADITVRVAPQALVLLV